MRSNSAKVSLKYAAAALAFSGTIGAASVATAATPEEIRQQIINISALNTERRDNIEDVRKQLIPLVDELVSAVPPKPEAEALPAVAGGWRFQWSNQTFPPGIDYKQIYQVVSPDGYFYNLSRQNLPLVEPAAIFLRGQYKNEGSYLTVEFTRNFLSPKWLPVGTNLLEAAAQAEKNEIIGTDIPGPNGAKGTLANVYVDETLRIVKGGDAVQPERRHLSPGK